jgi:hypothetical protein
MRLLHPIPGARISQRFGENPAMYAQYNLAGHEGVDFAVPVGTPVRAAHDGVVRSAQGPTYGIQAWIEGDGITTLYAHLSGVLKHGAVRAGEVIGLSGNTGRSTGPHLHFGVRIEAIRNSGYKDWLDPLPYLVEDDEEEVPATMLTTAHVQRTEEWIGPWAADLGSGWIKVVNPPAGKRPYPQIPNLCVRIWTDDIDAQYVSRGKQGGVDFVRHMLPRWRETPATCYELANEPDVNSNDGLHNLREYTIGAIEEAERHGIKLCILNTAEGNPHDNNTGDTGVTRWKLQQLAPAVQRAVAGGHYLGIHAYWRPGVEGPTGRWHALGWVKWVIEQYSTMGVDIGRLQVLVNETGLDGGIAGHPAQQGWQHLSMPDSYRAEIVEAEKYARTIPQIQALMFFTFGFEPPWNGFNHHEAFAKSLIAPLKAINQGPTPPSQEGTVNEEHLRNAAWNALGIPYNPAAAFAQYAAAKSLGRPCTGEHDLNGIRWQGYDGGIVYATIGQWDKVTHIPWLK